jgi:LuxR family maltose regulon positive regulatory protein
VLSRLAQGLSREEIARRLGVGPETVKTQLRSIYRKLGVHRRGDAAARVWAE